jgi:hypothetical protein
VEISRMRKYLRLDQVSHYLVFTEVNNRFVDQRNLDHSLKQMMTVKEYDSFHAFQQLINDIYESDSREALVDLFQRYSQII